MEVTSEILGADRVAFQEKSCLRGLDENRLLHTFIDPYGTVYLS